MVTPRQATELFHLVFLRALTGKGDDKGLFALKGGCNLRIFFGSPRYSEDLDLDVVVVARGTLRNRVDRLLASPVVTGPLRAANIAIVDVSTPKQSDTTQRWKAGLRVTGSPVELRTQIEFSRRDAIVGAAFEAVDAAAVRPYAMQPFLANHYGIARAVEQKVEALAGRAEPQARDVFDLDLLFARPETATLALDAEARAKAAECATTLGFDDYAGQVVAWLHPDLQDVHGSRAAWGAMQERVVHRLLTGGSS